MLSVTVVERIDQLYKTAHCVQQMSHDILLLSVTVVEHIDQLYRTAHCVQQMSHDILLLSVTVVEHIDRLYRTAHCVQQMSHDILLLSVTVVEHIDQLYRTAHCVQQMSHDILLLSVTVVEHIDQLYRTAHCVQQMSHDTSFGGCFIVMDLISLLFICVSVECYISLQISVFEMENEYHDVPHQERSKPISDNLQEGAEYSGRLVDWFPVGAQLPSPDHVSSAATSPYC